MQGTVFAQLLISNVQPDAVTRSAPQLKARAQTTSKPRNAFDQALKTAQEKTQAPGNVEKHNRPDSKDSQPAGEADIQQTTAGRGDKGQAAVQPVAETSKETGNKDRAAPADSQPEAQESVDSLPNNAEQPQPVGVIPVPVITGNVDATVILQGDAEESGTGVVQVTATSTEDASLAGAGIPDSGWQSPEMKEVLESNQIPVQDEGQRFGQAKNAKEGAQPSEAKFTSSPPTNDANQVRFEVIVKAAAGSVQGQDDQTGKQAVGENRTNGNRGLHLEQVVAEVKHFRNEQCKEIQEQNKDLPEQKNQPAQTRTDVKKLIDIESARLRGAEKGRDQGLEKQEGGEKNSGEVVVKTLETPGLQRSVEAKETRPARAQFEDLMNQIVEKARIMVKDNKSTVTIQLKPEFLGKLHIQLTVEEGVLTARFIASNNQVKEMLEGGINQLRMVLENTGIRLERAEVSTDLGQTASFSGYDSWNWQQEQQSGFQGTASYWTGAELPLETEDYESLEPVILPDGKTETGLNVVV